MLGPLLDAIAVLTEGLAVFDKDANLVVCNSSFRKMNSAIEDALQVGMPWGMFLLEAVQRGALTKSTCTELELMENRLLDGVEKLSPISGKSAQGRTFQLQLAETSDGGFLLTQSVAIDPDLEQDSARQADLLLSKVLEACPANLTMSRIGDGQVIYRSPSATELLGKSKSSFDHFSHREQRADFVTALLPDARVDDLRFTGRHRDGHDFPARISARLIDYHGEDVIVANIVDMTDQLALQKKLAKQREQLFQSEKMSALGELLAGVAHELNNPLSIVVGNAVMLKEDMADPALLRRVDKISDAAERCVRIVRSFLAMARNEPLNIDATNLLDVISTAVDAIRANEAQDDVSIVVEDCGSVPMVRADAVQIAQVVINLVTNAQHAIEIAGIGDCITIQTGYDALEDMAVLSVTDNGPGVPEQIQSRIFDPLFTTKDVGKGTGVGLAFCHRIIASHNGSIQIADTDSRGARFDVKLPVWVSRDEQ